MDQALDRVAGAKAVKVKKYGKGVGAIVLNWPKKIRIYYGIHADNTIILLGGDETNQSDDIGSAQGYWQDFQGRA